MSRRDDAGDGPERPPVPAGPATRGPFHHLILERLRHERRRAGGHLVRAGLHGLARLGALHPRAKAAHEGIEVLRDIPYRGGGDPAHTLDVYRPEAPADGPRPAVLYVHGGGFRICSKETHWAMALAFARRGHVVFNINYRLAPAHPYPAAIEDTCAAALWVQEAALRYGADPSRLVFAGESAGGNLVTSLAVVTSYPRPEPWARAVFDSGLRPRAVVAACAMLQVSDPGRFARRRSLPAWLADRIFETSRGYLGADVDGAADPESLLLADPLVLLERGLQPDRPLPPFFVPVGTKDPLIDDTRRLRDALEKLGATCDARFYSGGIHAFHAFLWQKLARACWKDQTEFLAKYV